MCELTFIKQKTTKYYDWRHRSGAINTMKDFYRRVGLGFYVLQLLVFENIHTMRPEDKRMSLTDWLNNVQDKQAQRESKASLATI